MNRISALAIAILICACSGDDGKRGSRGSKGEAGIAAIDGADGNDGKRGTDGTDGEIGPPGPIGPVIHSMTVESVPTRPGDTVFAQVQAQSAENLPLAYRWYVAAGWAPMSAVTGKSLLIQAPPFYDASATASVRVTDAKGHSAMGVVVLTTERNFPPIIESISSSGQPAAPGGAVQLNVQVIDLNDDPLVIWWELPAGWGSAVTTGSSISATAPGAYDAIGYATVHINDGYEYTQLAVELRTAGNRGPVLDSLSVGGVPVEPGGTIYVLASAHDDDGETLTYNWITPPGWGAFPNGKWLTLTAPDCYGEMATVTVEVSDGTGTVRGVAFVYTSTSPGDPIIQSMTVSPIPIVTTASLSAIVFDPIGDPMSYTWYVGGISTGTGPTANWTNPGIPGMYEVKLVVEASACRSTVATTDVEIGSLNPWPKLGRDLQNTSRAYGVSTTASGTIRWKLSSASPSNGFGTPAIGLDGILYVGSSDGKFYSVRPTDGSVRWTFQSGSTYDPAIIGHDDTIFVRETAPGKKLFALQSTNGSVKWEKEVGFQGYGSMTLSNNGVIYVTANDNTGSKLFAISATSGAVIWSYSDVFSYGPTLASDGTVYVSALTDILLAIHPNGTLKWQSPIPGLTEANGVIAKDGTILVGTGLKKLYALRPDGSLKWSVDLPGRVGRTAAVAIDGSIYLNTYSPGFFVALWPDGSQKWSVSAPTSVGRSPTLGVDGSIYFSTGLSDARVYAFTPEGQLKWSIGTCTPPCGEVNTMAIGIDGALYFGSNYTYLYSVE